MSRDAITDRINAYVTKYMAILGIGGEPPVVKLRTNLGSKWLGRSTWSTRNPHTTLLELQTSILGDDRTLERVIAHEMIHHRDSIAISGRDLALLRIGLKPEAHGQTFRDGASIINAIMGPGFVTAVSDKEYKREATHKKFVVLITPLPKGRLGWAWAAHLGPKAKVWADELVTRGSRLAYTTDERWAKGTKIARYGGYSVPRDADDVRALQELFDAA